MLEGISWHKLRCATPLNFQEEILSFSMVASDGSHLAGLKQHHRKAELASQDKGKAMRVTSMKRIVVFSCELRRCNRTVAMSNIQLHVVPHCNKSVAKAQTCFSLLLGLETTIMPKYSRRRKSVHGICSGV